MNKRIFFHFSIRPPEELRKAFLSSEFQLKGIKRDIIIENKATGKIHQFRVRLDKAVVEI